MDSNFQYASTEHRISRWVDRMAAGLTEARCASERGLAMGGGRPAERPDGEAVTTYCLAPHHHHVDIPAPARFFRRHSGNQAHFLIARLLAPGLGRARRHPTGHAAMGVGSDVPFARITAAPESDGWLHEIKHDSYRMHTCLDRGVVKLLTRTGLV